MNFQHFCICDFRPNQPVASANLLPRPPTYLPNAKEASQDGSMSATPRMGASATCDSSTQSIAQSLVGVEVGGVMLFRSVLSGTYLHVPQEMKGDKKPVWQVCAREKCVVCRVYVGGVMRVCVTGVRAYGCACAHFHVSPPEQARKGIARAPHARPRPPTHPQRGGGEKQSEGSEWEVEASPDGKMVKLRSVRSGKYLHVPEEHQGDGQPVWQWRNGDSSGSYWQVVQCPGTRRFRGKALSLFS